MKWFEPIIIVVVVAFVIWVIYSQYFKKGKKNSCTGACNDCTHKCNGFVSNYHKENGYRYILRVEGMKCGSCESHINDTIRKNFDVLSVKSSRVNQNVIINSKNKLNIGDVKQTIAELGYKVY